MQSLEQGANKTFQLPTRSITLSKKSVWAIFQCLQTHLSGFNGRAETSDPWHGVSLMRKLIEALPYCQTHGSALLELNEGELLCIMYNLPQDLFEESRDILLRVATLIEEFSWPIAIGEIQEPKTTQEMLDKLRDYWDSQPENT